MHHEILIVDHGHLAPALEVAPAVLTIDDVLELLAELRTAYAWDVDDLGLIRAMARAEATDAWGTHISPLTALVHALTGHWSDCWLHWDAHLAEAAIPLAVASELVAAEDGNGLHDAALRGRLLAVLGLGDVLCL